jgi:hypothetical protein
MPDAMAGQREVWTSTHGRGTKYHIATAGRYPAPACNPKKMLFYEPSMRPASQVPVYMRCQRPGCRGKWPGEEGPMPDAKTWPRLSETLPHPRDSDVCQACGGEADSLWVEHDERDQPEAVAVALCRACQARLIEPHPRLYRQLSTLEPWPGALGICRGCAFHGGLRCTNPASKLNGGRGMRIDIPQPDVVHVDGRDSRGRRFGRTMTMYRGPATACSGRQEATAP